MKRVSDRLIRGAARSLAGLFADVNDDVGKEEAFAARELRAKVGIDPEQWMMLRIDRHWLPVDIPAVRAAIQELLTGAQMLAGLADTEDILAEEAAVVVATVIHPINWSVASNLVRGCVSGAAMLGASHDEVVEYERLSSVRMRGMIFYAANIIGDESYGYSDDSVAMEPAPVAQ